MHAGFSIWRSSAFPPRQVAEDCARGRRDLEAFLPDGVTLEGFSTHLNVSVTPGRELAVARRFIATFSAAMMLLIDGADSPGILVRPRPGRLEIGGEFQDGQALTAALHFVAGATHCCDVSRRQWRHEKRRYGAELVPKVERAVERFGWFIDRNAFGNDLYRHGRATILPLAGGATISAQHHLSSSWKRARLRLPTDLHDVEGRLIEDHATSGSHASHRTTSSASADPKCDAGPRPSPFGSLINPRVRGALHLTAEVVTWGFVVFALSDGTRRCHLTVPGPELEAFLDGVDNGTLDSELHRHLDRPHRAKLSRATQTGSVDAYRELPNPAALLPPERDPGTGRFPRGHGGGGITGGRPGKRSQNELRPPTRPKWVRPAVISAVALIVIVAIAAALSNRGQDKPILAAAAVPTTTVLANTTNSPTQDADYGEWESTAGTISLQRSGDRLVGRVIAVAPGEPGAPQCQLQLGQELFSVTADPPGNVGTVPTYGSKKPFIGTGSGTLQRLVTKPDGTMACANALTPDVPLVLVLGREGVQAPGSTTIEPSLYLAEEFRPSATGPTEWYPFDYRFARVSEPSGLSLEPADATPSVGGGADPTTDGVPRDSAGRRTPGIPVG